MKQLLTALLLCLTISATYGQAGTLHLEAGYTCDGKYQLHIVNGQGCHDTLWIDGGSAIPVVVTSQDQIYYIPNNPIVTHNVVSSICGNHFSITTGINTCKSLPMKIINPNAIEINKDSIRVTFTSLDETNVKYYKMSVSLDDGLTWREVWVYAIGLLPKTNYSVTFKK